MARLISPLTASLAVAFLSWAAACGQEDAASENRLFDAARDGDVAFLQIAIPKFDVNTCDEAGRTPLMVAVENGQFYAARYLLSQGADANLSDTNGKGVRAFIPESRTGFSPLNLLIRCYAYVQKNGVRNGSVTRPELILINDDYIDHTHPSLKKRYWRNDSEASGTEGVDDDGNGFVDDVFGWNLPHDAPLKAPFVEMLSGLKDRSTLQDMMDRYREAKRTLSTAEVEADVLPNHPIARSYENPVARDVGSFLLVNNDVDFNDYRFCRMLEEASHGTHVAGIALRASKGQARIHGINWHPFHLVSKDRWWDRRWLEQLARLSPTYQDFMVNLRNSILENALASGSRMSAYLRSTGAGVVNMSWSKNRQAYRDLAADAQRIYREKGVDPASADRHVCPVGLDFCGDLAIELAVATGAFFAIVMYENPDVLFVMSAGNKGENSDVEVPVPAYLSRFFPNAINVAWLAKNDRLSTSSNYGLRSVQLAAPGEQIESALVGGLTGRMSGTSMAAPQVAGAAARIRKRHPDLGASDVRRILERSVRRMDTLSDRVETGGSLDGTAAIKLASAWNPRTEPFGAEELERRRLHGSAPEGPILAGLRHHQGERYWEGPAVGSDRVEDAWRVTAIGGYDEQWRVVMGKGTPFLQQIHTARMNDPWDLIEEKRDEGYLVSALGGDQETGWAAVLSRGMPGTQKIVEYDWTAIEQAQREGYRVTDVAGWRHQWRFVLNTGTELKKQRICLPTAFDASRRAWIDALMADGYSITAVCGDDDSSRNSAYWVVVMSEDPAVKEQRYQGPGPWPKDWIAKNEAEGFRVSACTGYSGRWVVVMNRPADEPPAETRISPVGAFPKGWIQERW